MDPNGLYPGMDLGLKNLGVIWVRYFFSDGFGVLASWSSYC
jgi:hypothetical protein